VVRAELENWAPWKVWLVVLLAGIAWPLWAGFRLAQTTRFWLIVRQARGSRCALSNDGIAVSINGGPARHVSWPELANARWVEHLEPDVGWQAERLAVSIRSKRLALSEQSGDLRAIFKELARRGVEPRLVNGGKGWNRADGLFSLAWWVVALVVAFVVWG
jgi:hypothetical protein